MANYAKAGLAVFLLSVFFVAPGRAQTPTISSDRTVRYMQTDSGTVSLLPKPYSFVFRVGSVGNSPDLSQWGPAFYIPGSGGITQAGTSSETNIGTPNSSSAPNNYSDYLFTHDFSSSASLQSFYPVAPTDGGSYGVEFGGSAPPSPTSFSAGLAFTGGAHPSATPQISNVDNGTYWKAGVLHIRSAGKTTLSLNSFPEYDSATYGSMIVVGVYSNSGVVADASHESYYLPLGDSPGADPVSQSPITNFALNWWWFSLGKTYTLEPQYLVFAGQPDEANLNGI